MRALGGVCTRSGSPGGAHPRGARVPPVATARAIARRAIAANSTRSEVATLADARCPPEISTSSELPCGEWALGERPGIARPSMITTRPAGAPCASGWSSCSFTRAAPAVIMTPRDIAARLTAERAMWGCVLEAHAVGCRPTALQFGAWPPPTEVARTCECRCGGPGGPRSELGRSSSRLRLVLLQLPQLPRSRFSHLGGSRAPLRAWVVVQLRRARVGRRSARGSTETRPRGGVCFVLGFVIMAREFCQT